jgi:hypothetical protein
VDQRMLIAERRRQSNKRKSAWAAECLEWTRRHAVELPLIG